MYTTGGTEVVARDLPLKVGKKIRCIFKNYLNDLTSQVISPIYLVLFNPADTSITQSEKRAFE